MSKKNEDVKAAIDAIFEDDFIEIKKTDETPTESNITFSDYEDEEEKEITTHEDNDISNNDSYVEEDNNKIQDNIDDDVNNDNINNDYYNEEPIFLTKQSKKDKIFNSIKKENILKNFNKDNIIRKFNKDNILYTLGIIGIISLVIVLVITIFVVVFGVKKNVKCVSKATDEGYSFMETYEITYKKNDIIRIKSIYRYEATSADFLEQVQFVKKDKVPVVVNSNGMKGFNYIIEEKDDAFEVTGYLDFKEMDFTEVDKVDKKLFPISYIDFDSKTTYKDMEKSLKKKGFTCSIVK